MNPMSDSGVVVDAQGFVGAQGSNGFTWIAKEPVAPNPKFDLIGDQMQILNVGLGLVLVLQLSTKIAPVVVQPNTNGIRFHGNPWPHDRDQIDSGWQVMLLACFEQE